MADLNSDLQASIDALGTQHSNLVQAVRDYNGGSVASATNDMLASVTEVTATIKSTERSLLGLVNRSNDEKLPTMLLDFASQTYFTGLRGLEEAVDPHKYLNVSRSTSKWVMGPQGKLVEVPPNTLAYEYDPVTGEAKGVLIEESRTNLLTWSEDTSGWGNGDGVELEATSAPSPIVGVNYLRLYALNDASSAGIYRGYSISDRVNGVHTGSFFVKSAGASIVRFQIGSKYSPYSRGTGLLDLETGEFSYSTSGAFTELNASAIPLGNGEYRVSVTGAQNADASLRFYIYAYDERGDDIDSSIAAGSGLYVTGFQVEEAPTLSSYIPTTDSPVTRAEDSVSRELGNEFKSSEGTLYADLHFPNTASEVGSNYALQLSNSVTKVRTTNSILVWRLGTEGGYLRIVFFGESERVEFQIQLSDPTSTSVAMSWDASTVRFAIDGQSQSKPLVGFDPAAFTHITAGLRSGSDRSRNLQTVNYMPYAMTETELQELTANG